MEIRRSGEMSNSKNVVVGGQSREGTRVVLREITAMLNNSPPTQTSPRRKTGNDTTNNTFSKASTEHEVKVRFAREFADADLVTYSTPESFSSESSYYSIGSTQSTKTSGINSDIDDINNFTLYKVADTSYVDNNIPDVNELIRGCADIRLDSTCNTEEVALSNSIYESPDDTLIQTFDSAIDDTNVFINEKSDLSITKDDIAGNVQEIKQDLKEYQNESVKLILETSTPRSTTPVDCNNTETTKVEHICNDDNNDKETDTCNKIEKEVDLSNTNKSVEKEHIEHICNDINDKETDTSNKIEKEIDLNNTDKSIEKEHIEHICNDINDKETDTCNKIEKEIDLGIINVNVEKEHIEHICNDINDKETDTFNKIEKEIDLSNTDKNKTDTNNTCIDQTVTNIVNEIINSDDPDENIVIDKNNIDENNIDIKTNINEHVNDITIVINENDINTTINVNEREIDTTINVNEREIDTTINISENVIDTTINTGENKIDTTINVNEPVIDTTVNINEPVIDTTVNTDEHKIDTTINTDEYKIDTTINIINDKTNTINNINENKTDITFDIRENKKDIINNISEYKVDNKLIINDNNKVDLTFNINDNKTNSTFNVNDNKINSTFNVNENNIERENLIVKEIGKDLVDSKKESTTTNELLDETLTLTDDIFSNNDPLNEIDRVEFNYDEFKPQRQSTTLTNNDDGIYCSLEKLELAVGDIADDIFKSPLVLEDDVPNSVLEIFHDPTTFDFLSARGNSESSTRLRNESLFIKFDPLLANTSMLPQGNSQVFSSPTSGTIHKLEEIQDKNDEPLQVTKSDTKEVENIDGTGKLELLRATVSQLEKELEKQKKEYESKLEKQKTISQEKLAKLQALLNEEVENKNQLAVVVDEYEKSISRLLTEKERDHDNLEQEKSKIQEELQATNLHLSNTEAAFNDVHLKYERLKGVVSAYKNNEGVLKEGIQENLETIKSLENRYDQLKTHAMSQLRKANLELVDIRKQHEAETVKLHAMVRKAELKSNSLAEIVEQKTKENKELTQILDELIARVGRQNAE